MKAVVMAGGEGSRLRPLTLGRPKPMVSVVDKPMIEHIIDLLKRYGINDMVITLQYMADSIQSYFGDGSAFGVNIQYSIEETPLGTAGSVKQAEALLDDTFIIISGDALTDFDLEAALDFHKARKSYATLILKRVPNPLEYGVIITDERGAIRQFLEKPSWSEVFSDTVNTGIYVIEPRILDYFETGKVFDFSKDLFPMMLEKGDPLYGYVAEGYWCDIGNLADYLRSCGDLLDGQVNLPLRGSELRPGLWVDEDVEISPSAHIEGPVYLGPGVRIHNGVTIIGPSAIRDNTIVDTRATIDHSIIWRNCYIGERAELRGAILSSQCGVKARAMLFEGTVIGDDTQIDEGAVIQPGVKVWPGKHVEAGATVSTSLVWGSQGRRVLFGRFGVTGLVNVDITPEFAAKMGAAYGATLAKNTTVMVNRDAHYTPRMIKRGLVSGLPSAGVNVSDLGSVPIPVARYNVRSTDAAGGIHVQLSPFDGRTVDIKFFDRNGLDIDKNTERKIEGVFFREDFRRVYLDEIGRIEYASNVIGRYVSGYLSNINAEAMHKNARDIHIVVDYANTSSAQVLPNIFTQLNLDVVELNAHIDDSANSRVQEQFQEGMERLSAITNSLRAAFGARLDTGGERVYFVDDRGRQVDRMKALCAIVALHLKTYGGGIVAVPVTAPSTIEHIARQYGAEVIRTRANNFAVMTTALRSGVTVAGDGAGSFFFPAFHPTADGLFTITKLAEMLTLQNTSFSEVLAGLPPFAMARGKVQCRWEDKGRVMRLLNEQYGNAKGVRQIDGIRVELGREWALILPDPDIPYFHIYAEADSDDHARALVEKYAGLVNGLQ